MKNFFVLGFILFSLILKGQEAEKVSVEKKLIGVQLGFLDSGFYYETMLQRKITLRTELGLGLTFSTRNFENPSLEDQTSTLLVPYITLEPRWYYGLDRRKRIGKKTDNNSSNYISVATSYISTRTPVVNSGNFNVVSAINIFPKFGIRRAFAKHFNYEFAGGYGYQYNIFSKAAVCSCNHHGSDIDIQARIGYDF